jgi:DNA-directed RNA polymerase delta subunit
MREKVSVRKAAKELLEEAGKPMHYMEILKRILHRCNLQGKTPHETVRALMGTSPDFIRVAEGIYALSAWKKYKPARFAKDIAYSILESKGKPMPLDDLGVKIAEERKFVGSPKVVARNAIRNDKRFRINKMTELVYLVEWDRN